jgi:hypothetical protein
MTVATARKDLVESLRKAARRSLTPAELEAQRVSFIIGSVKSKNVTEARVREVLKKHESGKR